MKTPIELAEELYQKTEEYTRTNIELIKLKAIDLTAAVISTLAVNLIMVLVFTLFFTMLNIAVAIWLGTLLGNYAYGFFIVSGFYAVIGVLLYLCRKKWIKIPVSNSIIKQALK